MVSVLVGERSFWSACMVAVVCVGGVCMFVAEAQLDV